MVYGLVREEKRGRESGTILLENVVGKACREKFCAKLALFSLHQLLLCIYVCAKYILYYVVA